MSNYEPIIEQNNTELQSNNTDLQGLLDTINALPVAENLDDALDEQESIIEQIQAALEGKAAASGVSLDVITAASLPASVVDNQIIVITSTTPSTIYVDTDEPANPVEGDVWVQVGSSEYGVEFSETFRNGLTQAAQYSGRWQKLDGYVGVSDVWQQFTRSIPAIGTPLADWTWEQIVILANSGEDVTQYFAVGDEKNLVLTTGEVVPVVIGDFNHNTITNSGGAKASIAFTFKNCLNTTYAMNDSNTNSGGWDGSKMRTTHMVNIFNTFPAELRAEGAVKYVDVVATAGDKSTSLVTSSDRLRLHSITELGLTYSYTGTEGTAYSYYASGNRVKTVNGTASYYWTRSPNTGNSDYFCCVSSSGTAVSNSADSADGVACGFDI